MTAFRHPYGLMLVALALVGCSGGSSAPIAPGPSPTPMLGPSSTISDSGSTNRKAFTIVVQTDGSATVTQNGSSRSGNVGTSTASTYFADLKANSPVANLPIASACPKSASFGSTTTVTYQGSTSGDVSCPPANSSTQTIYNDVQAIEAALGL